jgi:uncharacterized protein YegL
MNKSNPFIGKIDNNIGIWKNDQTDPYSFPYASTRRIVQTYTPERPTQKYKNLFSTKITECGTKYHHIVLILDESSSMQGSQTKTINTINEFLDTIRKEEIPTFVSIVTFNGSDFKWVKTKKNVKSIENLTHKDYTPNGMTNLVDTIGYVLDTLNSAMFLENEENRGATSVYIVTDGEENTSKFYDKSDIKTMVSQLEPVGYAFRFFGADIDAFAESSSIGLGSVSTMSFNKSNIHNLGEVMGNYTALRSASLSSGSTSVMTTNALYETTHGQADRDKLK